MRVLIVAACILICLVEPSPAGENKALLQAQEAGAALVRGQFERAILLYDEVLNAPDLVPARKSAFYSDRGVAKWRLQRHEEAIEDFNRAIQGFPEFASAYNNRGNVLLELGFAKEAIKDFDRAIMLAAGYGPAYNNRANAYLKLGDYGKAVVDYGKAIEFMPTNAVPFNGRGKAHLAKRRYHAAVRDFTRAISLNAKYLSAYINRAQAHRGLKDFLPAIADLDYAITNQPEQARLYTARGNVHQARGKHRPALKDLDKAISLDNSNARAYAERGTINASSGAFQDAVDDLSYAIQMEPTLADAYAERAFAHYSTGDPARALPDVNKAIELDAKNARAFLIRAQILESTSDVANAINDYRKAFDLDPELKEARVALERLAGEVIIPVVEKVGEPLDGWEITRAKSGDYVASNAKYDSVKVPLEMYGGEKPELLEWTPLKQNFNGIGLLRYYAGTTVPPERARVENIAVIDLYQKKVASIEPFKWGTQKSKWDWGDGNVVVTDHEGGTNDVRLRRPRYVARRQWDDDGNWWSQQGGEGWVYENGRWVNRGAVRRKRTQKKKSKSLFDLLFN